MTKPVENASERNSFATDLTAWRTEDEILAFLQRLHDQWAKTLGKDYDILHAQLDGILGIYH